MFSINGSLNVSFIVLTSADLLIHGLLKKKYCNLDAFYETNINVEYLFFISDEQNDPNLSQFSKLLKCIQKQQGQVSFKFKLNNFRDSTQVLFASKP